MAPNCGAVQMVGLQRVAMRGRGGEKCHPCCHPCASARVLPPLPGRGAPLTSADHVLSARVEAGGAAGEGAGQGRGCCEGRRAAGMGRKLALGCSRQLPPAPSLPGFPPPYLDVPQRRAQHAQVRCLLVVHVGDVALQCLKAFLQMGPPGETRASSAGQPAPGG